MSSESKEISGLHLTSTAIINIHNRSKHIPRGLSHCKNMRGNTSKEKLILVIQSGRVPGMKSGGTIDVPSENMIVCPGVRAKVLLLKNPTPVTLFPPIQFNMA